MLVSKWVPYDAMLLQNALPDVLCVVQVALEGAVSKKAALNSLAQGNLPQASPFPLLVCVFQSDVSQHQHSSPAFLLPLCSGSLPTCVTLNSCWCPLWLLSAHILAPFITMCQSSLAACKLRLTCSTESKRSAARCHRAPSGCRHKQAS